MRIITRSSRGAAFLAVASTNEKDFPVPNQAPVAGNGIKMPRWGSHAPSTHSKGKSMAIVTLGIDLAKNVFARPASRVNFCFTGAGMT
jgi:hypothetical protein